MRRRALAPICLAVALASITLRAQTPAIDIAISTPSASVRQRIETTAARAVARYTEWLGALPAGALSIGDTPHADVLIDAQRWDAPGSMRLEASVATQVAQRWLNGVAGDDQWRNGAAWYLQSRVVPEVFDLQFHRPGYRYDTLCFFGCAVPWALPALPLDRWTAAPDGMARAFTTLEREVGWPALQGALRAVVAAGADPVGVMSDAIGRDVSGVFAAARSGAASDPAIASFESTPAECERPCYRTQVFVEERGPVPLPLRLRVTFDDQQSIDARWDGGRDRFEFESKARAIAVQLDPDRVWQLDRNPFNNARLPPAPTNVPVWKWMARWIIWLQDAVLTQTFPV